MGEYLGGAEVLEESQEVFAEGVVVRSIMERGNIWGNGDFAAL